MKVADIKRLKALEVARHVRAQLATPRSCWLGLGLGESLHGAKPECTARQQTLTTNTRAPFWVHLLGFTGAAAVATAFTAVAIRTPDIWPFLPRAPMELALKVLGASNQEQVADAEFLGIWIPSFAVLVALFYLVAAVVRRVSGR
ncbi:hypothetical protein ACLIJR_13545 [Hydrogenophaga sp. XSHU_21]